MTDISGTITSDSSITGSVTPSEIAGVLSSAASIAGVITDGSSITGIIENDTIIGVLTSGSTLNGVVQTASPITGTVAAGGIGGAETDPIVGAVSGIVKADGAGNISAATPGTDYLTPTGDGSGLSGVVTTETDPIVGAISGIVKADGGGNISAAVADTDYQSVPAEGAFADGDKTKLDGIEAGADVTDAANVNAVEADPIVGAVNGIVKADGAGNISAASAGTDYLTPSGDGSSLMGIDYSVVSGNDGATDVTAAELEELTDGSETTKHDHPASAVNITDSGGYFTGTEVETALQELGASVGSSSGAGGHLHGLARWVADGSLTDFELPDLAEYLDNVTDEGTEVDALDYSLSSDQTQLSFDAAPTVAHVIQAHYVIAQI